MFIGFAFYFLAFLKYDKWNMIECDRIDEWTSVWGRVRAHVYLESSIYTLYQTRRPSIVIEWMNEWMSDDE